MFNNNKSAPIHAEQSVNSQGGQGGSDNSAPGTPQMLDVKIPSNDQVDTSGVSKSDGPVTPLSKIMTKSGGSEKSVGGTPASPSGPRGKSLKLLRSFSMKEQATGRRAPSLFCGSDMLNSTENGEDNAEEVIQNKHFISKLEGHKDRVTAVCVYYDVKNPGHAPFAITGSGDNSVKIWNMTTSSLLHSLVGHTDYITALVVDSTTTEHEPTVISASFDGTIRLWSITSGRHLRMLEGGHNHGVLTLCLYDHSKQRFRSAEEAFLEEKDGVRRRSSDGLRRTTTGFVSRSGGGGEMGSMAQFLQADEEMKNTLLLSAGVDRTIVIWNLKAGSPVFNLINTGSNTVHSLQVYNPIRDSDHSIEQPNIHRDLPIVIAGGSDKVLQFYDLKTGAPICKPLGGHLKTINSLVVYAPLDQASPVIITASSDKTLIVWDLYTGEVIRKLEGHTDKVCCVKVYGAHQEKSPLVISCSEDDSTIIWDLITGCQVRKICLHDGGVVAISVYPHPKGPMILTGGVDSSAAICNFTLRKRSRKWVNSEHQRDSVGVCSVAIFVLPVVDKDGKRLSTCAFKRKSGDQSTPKKSQQMSTNIAHARIEAQKRVAAASATEEDENTERTLVITGCVDSMIRVFDLDTLETVVTIGGHKGRINAISTYMDDKTGRYIMVSSSSDHTSKSWQLGTWNQDTDDWVIGSWLEMQTFKVHAAAVMDNHIFQPKSGEFQDRLLLITSSHDKTEVVINDLDTGEIICQYHEHTEGVKSIAIYEPADVSLRIGVEEAQRNAFIPPYIISASYDKSTLVWDIYGKTVLSLAGEHTDYVSCVQVYDPSQYDVSSFQSRNSNNLSAAAAHGNIKKSHALIITGSYDSNLIVWDLFTGKKLKKMSGHKGPITSLALFVSEVDKTAATLAVSTSLDKTCKLWNVQSGECVNTLFGHQDKINCCITFAHRDVHKPPIIVSGSDDRSVMLWEDHLYAFKLMPLADSVMRAFEFDAQAPDKDWPILSNMLIAHGIGIFIENPDLFFLAVLNNHPDFLSRFKPMLCFVLRYANFSVNSGAASDRIKKLLESKKRQIETDPKKASPRDLEAEKEDKKSLEKPKSLLMWSIEMSDLTALHIILDCWTEVLNQDIDDYLTQRSYHPSYFLDKEDLVALIEGHPKEFSDFICSLRLVRCHGSVLARSVHHYAINTPSRAYVKSSPTENARLLWNGDSLPTLDDDDENTQLVTPLMLPLRYACHMDMLRCYAEVGAKLASVDIFNSNVGIYAIECAWNEYGKGAHVQAMAEYMLFLAIYSLACYSQEKLSNVGIYEGKSIFLVILHVLVLCIVFRQATQEALQLLAESEGDLDGFKKASLDYITDFWNLVDVCVICSAVTGVSIRMHYNEDTPLSRPVLALASVLIWFKILYFMRPFQASGPLVSMIIQIGKDIRYFLLVQLLMICGFAQAFWLLAYGVSGVFFSPSDSFLRTFIYMLGQGFDTDLAKFQDSSSPLFNTLLFCTFLLFLFILMLNLLISLMSDSYAKVREKGLGTWRAEQTSIIMAQAFKLGEKNVYECNEVFVFVHVLKYASDVPDNEGGHGLKETWDDKLGKHIDLIKDDMKTYSLLDIAHNIKGLDAKSSDSTAIIEERIAVSKHDQETKIGILSDKVDLLEEKLDLILAALKK